MWKKWYFWCGWLALFLATAATVYVWGSRKSLSQTTTEQFTADPITAPEEPVAEPEPPPDPLRPVYGVIVGYGGGSHAGGALADTIIVVQLLPRQEKINLISLPRDLWVKLPFSAQADTTQDWYTKINSTFAIGNSQRQYTWRPDIYQGKHGGGQLLADVVSDIIGQEVEYYLAVDFAGFQKIINLIAGQEGLKVDVPYSFVDEFYPIAGEEDNPCGWSEEDIATMSATLRGYELEQQFPCRYERLEFRQGVQRIPADQLLKFARSRHSGVGGGDFGRSQRQEVVIEAVKDKLFSVSMIVKIPELLGNIWQMVTTNADLELVRKALLDYGDVKNWSINSQVISNQNLLVDGRSSDGQYVLRPRAGQDDYHDIQVLVLEMAGQASAEAELTTEQY